MRHLYMLELTEFARSKLLPVTEYNSRMIVRARSSDRARKLARGAAIDEPDWFWIVPTHSKLRKIGEATPGTRQKEEIVMREDNAW